MKTNNKILKKVLCLFFICVIFISNGAVVSFADDSNDHFYTNDKDALDDLFNMTVADLYGDVKDPMGFISDGRTFVVIREYLDNDDNTKYKIYVNTPNLPQYLQNLALKTISDGWEDKTFEPESTLVSDVGKNENNIINKFGFHIAVNKYQGEYPRLYMSLSGILPVKWYQKIWRGLKALIGLSFVNAPDKENFRTLNYYNHMYSEVDEDLIDFIQEYWLDYFVGINGEGIWSDENSYFRDAEDFRAQMITKDEVDEANNWLDNNEDARKEAHKAYDAYNDWCDKYCNYEGVYTNIPEFRADLDTIQDKIDNATSETDKAKYEKQYQNKQAEWEEYKDKYAPPMPKYTEEQSKILAKELGYQSLLDRYADFEKKWNAGKKKNEKDYKTNDDYALSYAQCLLDISENVIDEAGGENDCTKVVDGQSITGSIVEVFVNSGAYKIGLTKESKQKVSEGTSGDKLRTPVNHKLNPDKGAAGGITSYFGNRPSPGPGASTGHGGIDIAWGGCDGKPVLAAAGGKVILAGQNSGYGNCVIIQHNDRVKTLYGHMSKISVSKGDIVTGGQEIGKIGNTGISYGSHLHFEVRINDKRVDPLDYLDTSVGIGFAEPLEYKDSLTRAEAIKIITLLQSKCGPTYKEVMENIVAVMIQNAYHAGEEIELEEYIDLRMMPYDRNTLIPSGGGGTEINGETVHIDDPRVNIYKTENIIGSYVVTGRLHTEYILKNKLLVRLAIWFTSLFSRWSVFFNQVTNFQVLDNLGLSPTHMWTSFSAKVVTSIIMLMLIINIIITAFKVFKGNAGIGQVIGKLLFFLGVLTLIFLLVLYPDTTWNNYKKVFNKVNNFGETAVVSTMDNVGELYGDGNDASVTYYLPYFNLWTLYNTGYSLSDPHQVIDYNDPETENMSVPTINGSDTTLWSVVLADSFNRQGINTTNMSLNSKNGLSVNANAYRVVDHFLAPRLYTTGPTEDGGEGSLNMVNTVNENFNGKFQKMDFFTGIGGIVNAANLCLIAFIKMMTFLWMWYMLYIFVFNIVLSAAQRNGLKNVAIRTLSPILAMAVIGAYAGLVVQISMLSEGFINFVINCVLMWLTFRFLVGWQNNFELSFPAPLKYLVVFVDKDNRSRYLMQRKIAKQRYDSRFEGTVDINSIIDEDGNYKGAADDERAKREYELQIMNAQQQVIGKTNYDAIENERLRKKIEQLDRVQGKAVPGKLGTATFNMEDELRNHSMTYDDKKASTSTTTAAKPSPKPNMNKPGGASFTDQTGQDQQKRPKKEFDKIGEGGKTSNKGGNNNENKT